MGNGNVFVMLFLGVMGIVWILLPFAVFGIKDLLRQMLAEQRRTNELLARVVPGTLPTPPEPKPFHPHRYP